MEMTYVTGQAQRDGRTLSTYTMKTDRNALDAAEDMDRRTRARSQLDNMFDVLEQLGHQSVALHPQNNTDSREEATIDT